MSPEQIAETQLSISTLQLWITGAAILLGPLCGVIFTLWFQRRKEIKDRKYQLFLTLMAHRKANPPTLEYVNSLNVIDVVFSENRKIVGTWHDYYQLLCQNPINLHLIEAKFLDLLSLMAKDLGYKELSQTDIAKYYSPTAHANQLQINQSIQFELLKFLQNLSNMSQPVKDIKPDAPSQNNN